MESLGPAGTGPGTRSAGQGEGRGAGLAGVIALVVLAGVWAWWAAKEGAYFGSVMYPGLVVLSAGFVLVASRTAWGKRLVLSFPAKLALGGLLALAAWSGLSAIWSPAPDVAVADAQRIFGYALAFGLGIWLRALLGKRPELALAPLALAGLFAGIVASVALLTGDEYLRYVDDGTLQYPLGYRNANAAFFLIALWPAVALAASRALDWRLRALSLGAATLCLELAMLSQSRGSVIAAIVALAVLLIVSRQRARDVIWLALAAVPALAVIPALTDLFATANLESYDGTAEIRAAGRAALGGAGLAIAIGSLAAILDRRVTTTPSQARRANGAVAVGAVGLALAGLATFSVSTGDPAGWVGDRVDEFLTQGSPGTSGTSSRFGADAGSERDDLWRVALRLWSDEPVLGLGGGGFQYEYPAERDEDGVESVRDAHSVELEVLSELGAPGIILFAVALGAMVAGAWRARADGATAALVAVALSAGAYWLAHASIDWFWAFPAVTAPVFALLGSACVGRAPAPEDRAASRWRYVASGGAAILALSVVPPFLAERYVAAAYDGWRSDPARAQADLDRARALNALSIEPLLAEGAIARVRGDREDAIAAFEEAAAERPEEWAAHYFLAALYRRAEPEQAQAALQRALRLNPFSEDLARLADRPARDRSRRQPRSTP